MSEKVRLFFTDIDGTLVDSRDNIGAVDERGLTALEAGGVRTVGATSRSHQLMRKILGRTGSRMSDAVLDNGATILRDGGIDHDHSKWLPREVAELVIGGLARTAAVTHIGYNGEDVRQFSRTMLHEYPVADSPSIFAYPTRTSDREAIVSLLADTGCEAHFNAYDGLPGTECVQIGASGVSKAKGVRIFQEILGVSPAGSAAIGDGEPDKYLLAAVDMRFAIADSLLAQHAPEGTTFVPRLGEGFGTAAGLILAHNAVI